MQQWIVSDVGGESGIAQVLADTPAAAVAAYRHAAEAEYGAGDWSGVTLWVRAPGGAVTAHDAETGDVLRAVPEAAT
jgi:hypothetical protein